MSALLALLAWCILFVLCWPLLRALLMLPARVLGYRAAA